MSRRRFPQESHLTIGLFVLVLILMASIGVRLFMLMQPHPIVEAWDLARATGAYRFEVDIAQTVDPLPSVANRGRSSETDTFRMEGQTDLRASSMYMRLWNAGGSVLVPGSGTEIRVADGVAMARVNSRNWEQISNFTGTFAPDGDFLTYLEGVRNIEHAGTETRAGITFTRYTFDINGPAVAMRVRQQLEAQMTEQGQLLPGMSLQLPATFAHMTGTGELWIAGDGLPLRQILRLQFPEHNDEQTSAEVNVTFSDYAALPLFAGWQSWPGRWGSALTEQAIAYLPVALAIVLTGSLTTLMIVARRSRRLAIVLAIVLCTILVTTPLLQNFKVAELGAVQAAEAAEFEAQQEVQETQQEALQRHAQPSIDPHTSPLETAAAAQEVETFERLASPREAWLAQAEEAEGQHLIESIDIPNPAGDDDGDGLTNAQEALLGTRPDFADSDSDGISDLAETNGFSFSNRQWYTDPLETDTNRDGIDDGSEVNIISDSQISVLNTDGDLMPDVYDTDNDNDGVPDELDLAIDVSSQTSGRTFDNDNPFTMQITDLEPGTPTLVDFQIRPLNPDHLWYTQSVLDWPTDRRGTIHDTDGATFSDAQPDSINSADENGDMRMVPMLEMLIDISNGAPSNLPLTAPEATFEVEPRVPNGPAGSVSLEDFGSNMRIISDISASPGATTELIQGTCDNPASVEGSAIPLQAGTTTLTNQSIHSLYIQNGEYRRHAVQVRDATGMLTLACGDLPLLAFDGPRMIDTELLEQYNASVRPGEDPTTEILVYVPLQLVTYGQTGEHVAFSARMFYEAASNWSRSHRINFIWMIQVLQDTCGPDTNENDVCDPFEYIQLNEPQVVHTYPEQWALTGIDVREDRGADLAVLLEDPAADPELEDNLGLHIVANGLAATYLEGADLSLPDLFNRFDYTVNGTNGTTLAESWGVLDIPAANVLRVEQRFDYRYIDELLADVIMPMDGDTRGESLAILEQYFSNHTDTIPTLMYVRSEIFREVGLEDVGDSVLWTSNNLTLGLPTTGDNAVPEQELRAVNWAPYRYNDAAGIWESVPLTDYWEELEQRYPVATLPTSDNDPTNDDIEQFGLLMMTRFFYTIFYQGLTNIVRIDNFVFNEEAINDVAYLDLIFGGAGEVESVVNRILRETAFKTGSSSFVADIGAASQGSSNFVSRAYSNLKNWVKTHKVVVGIAVGVLVVLGIAAIVTAILLTEPGAQDSPAGFFAATQNFLESDAGRLTQLLVGLSLALLLRLKSTLSTVKTGIQFLRATAASDTLAADRLLDKIKVKTVKRIKAGAIAAAIMIAIVVVATAIVLALQITSNNIDTGSVVFTQIIAFAIAMIIASLILFVIGLIPLVGKIISFVISILDTVFGFLGLPTISGLVTEIVFRAFYGFSVMANVEPAVAPRTFSLTPQNATLGMQQGNTLHLAQVMRTQISHRNPEPSEWQAFLYPYLYTEGNLRSSFVNFSLSHTQQTLTGGRGQISDQWQNVQRDQDFFDRNFGYRASIDQPMELGNIQLPTAGINQEPQVALNFIVQTPALECWTVPVPFPLPPFYIPVPICAVRNNDAVSGSSNYGANFLIDVFPATVDEFADKVGASAGQGSFRLAWDTRFSALADADGDGLRAPAFGGTDPDDSTWDTDGDGLSDMLEAQGRESGIELSMTTQDTDADGLTDAQELEFGSDPTSRDTDSDGLLDREEVYHQVRVNYSGQEVDIGGWTGGWEVVIDPASNLTIRVVSDPKLPDTDNDGILDSIEKVLSDRGYHPQVFNPNPVAIINEIEDRDGFVGAGDTIAITNRVENSLPGVFMEGRLQIDLPTSFGGGALTEDVSIATDEEQSFTRNLTVPDGATSQRADIRSLIQARVDMEPTSMWDMSLTAGSPRSPQSFTTGLFPHSAAIAPQPNRLDSYIITSQLASNNVPINDPLARQASSTQVSITTPSLPTGYAPHNSDVSPAGPHRNDIACNDQDVCLVVWSGWEGPLSGFTTPGIIKGTLVSATGNSFVGDEFEFNIATLPRTPISQSSTRPGDYILPTVASDGDSFMVSFVLLAPDGTTRVFVQRVLSNGDISGSPNDLTTTGSIDSLRFPDIVWTGDAYLVAYEDSFRPSSTQLLRVSTLNPQGQSTGSSLFGYTNSDEALTAIGRPRLASDPASRQALLVYDAQTTSLRGRLYDNGTWSNAFFLGFGNDPMAAYDPINDSWIVAFKEFTTTQLRVRALNKDGSLRSEAPQLLSGWTRHPARIDVSCQRDPAPPLIGLPFEDAPGTTAFNNTGTVDVPATCSGTRCPAAGVIGRTPLSSGVSFSEGDVLQIDDRVAPDELAIRGDMTLAAWVSPQDTSGIRNILAHDAGANSGHIALRINNGFYEVGTNNNYARFRIPEEDMQPGQWTYLVGTRSFVNWRLYRNGEEVDRFTSVVTPDAGGGSAVWSVGGTTNAADQRPFIGNMDDVQLYDFALPANVIRATFNNSNVSFCLAASANDAGQIQTAQIRLSEVRDILPPLTNSSIAPIVVDATRPTASFALQEGGIIAGVGNTIIGGSASDDSNLNDDLPGSGVDFVEVSVEGGEWQRAEGSEEWAFRLPTAGLDDQVSLRVRATDFVGLTGPASSVTVNLDRTPPLATINTPDNTIVRASRTEGQTDGVRGWSVPLEGTSSDPTGGTDSASGVESVGVLLTSAADKESAGTQDTTPQSSGAWTIDYKLPDQPNPSGRYLAGARAVDAVGIPQNETTVQSITLNIDNTPPVATLDLIGEFANTIANTEAIAVITRSVTLSGVVTDTGSAAAGIDLLEWALVPYERAEHLANVRDEIVLDLPFDGALPASLEDVSSQRNHTYCTGSTCPQPRSDGRVAEALTFDGVDDFLTAGERQGLRGDGKAALTVSAWIFPTGDPTNLNSIILNQEGEYEIARFPNGNLHWAYAVSEPSWTWVDTEVFLPLNTWSHVALSYDDKRPASEAMQVYLNGALATSQSADGPIGDARPALNEFQIGNRQEFNTPFTGSIDEVQVFSRALEPAEVQALFEDADRLWQPATLADSGNGVDRTTWTAMIPEDLEGFYQIDLRGTDVLGNRNEDRLTWLQWRGEIDTRAPQVQLGSASIIFADAVLNVSFDDDSTTIFTDTSSSAIPVTCSGDTCPTRDDSGPTAPALRFDGVDDFLTAGEQPDLRGDGKAALTVSAWIFPTDDPTNLNSIILNQEGEYEIARFPNGNLHWAYAVSEPSWTWVDTEVFLPLNTWSHVALSYDDARPASAAMQVYLNGALATSQSADGPIGDARPALNEFQIGNRQEFNTPFTGSIDEVQVFPRALEPAEVQALYIAVGGEGIPPEYLCRAQDLNLLDNDYSCVTVGNADGVQPIERTYYDTPLWQRIAAEAGQMTDSEMEMGRLIALEQTIQTEAESDPRVVACDTYGRCSEAGPQLLPLPPLSPVGALDGMPATAAAQGPALAQATQTITAVIRTPHAGAVFTSTNPVSITGVAVADSALDVMTFLVNGAPIQSFDLTDGERTRHTQAVAWTPPDDGLYGLQVQAQDTSGGLALSQPVTVVVDTQLPAVTVATDVLAGFGRGPTQATPFLVRGTATDSTKVRDVQVRVNAGPWVPAQLADENWSASVQPFIPLTLADDPVSRVAAPDGEPMTLHVRAIDVAGRTAQVTTSLLVDLAAPQPVNMTLRAEEGQNTRELAPGDVVRSAPATLILEWDESRDSSGLLDYAAGWTTVQTLSVTDIPAQGPIPGLTSYAPDATRQHTQQISEAEVRYAHLVIRDTYGNTYIQSAGPIYIDSAFTPDLLTVDSEPLLAQAGTDTPAVLRDYDGWIGSGCTMLGESQQMVRPGTQPTMAETQRFYTTWNDDELRMAWEGANWQGDGDLFLYFDADQTSGTDVAFTPYPAVPGASSTMVYLPIVHSSGGSTAQLAQGSEGSDSGRTERIPVEQSNIMLPFAADTLLWIEDESNVRLLRWNTISDTWLLDERVVSDIAVWYEVEEKRTIASIPFAALGIDDPTSTPLQFIALASEETALRLWGTMPPGNPVNSPRVINPYLASTLADSLFTLRRFYRWDGVGAGMCPSENKLTSLDVAMDLTADPPAMIYSFLGDDLFYMQDELFENQDVDSERIQFAQANFRPVPLEQEIIYTARYENTGRTTSPNARLQVVAWPPLRLPDGERINDADLGPFDQQIISLGDLAPGTAGTVTFRAQMEATSDRPDLVKASLDVVLLDDVVTAQTPVVPLEWFWSDHLIDREPPEISIDAPQEVIQTGTVNILGSVSDPGGMSSIALEQRSADGTITEHTCTDGSINSGIWSCPLPVRAGTDGEQIDIRARATDAYGQTSEWTEWRTLTVDTVAPEVSFAQTFVQRLTDGFFNPGRTRIEGTIVDNRQSAEVEVCRTVEAIGAPECSLHPVASSALTETWTSLIGTQPQIEGQQEVLAVTSIDAAGNRSTTTISVTYQIDSIPPTITASQERTTMALGEASNPDVDPAPVLRGTVSDGGAIAGVVMIIELPTGAARVESVEYNLESGEWAYSLRPQVAGTYTLRLEARDAAENTRSSQEWLVDVTE